MSRRDFIKITSSGQAFRLALFSDQTAREWRPEELEETAWRGSWRPINLKTGRSIELSIAGYTTAFYHDLDCLTGIEASEEGSGDTARLYGLREGAPVSWLP